MSSEKEPKRVVRIPSTWGVKAANRVDDRISKVCNRLGFDSEKPWELFSLETYEGKMGNLVSYLQTHLRDSFEHMGYQDRKAIFWCWPLPGDEVEPGSIDSHGVLRSIYLPKGTTTPDDLVRLELVDVHSQLLGRIGFEFLRLEELLSIWKNTAGHKQYLGAASMSRNLIEASASLYSLAKEIANNWSKCKTISGTIYETSTGGKVDRERAIEVDKLRRLLWNARNELKLHDIKSSGIDGTLAEWRHQDLFELLKAHEINFRREVTNEPSKQPVQLVRELDKQVVLSNTLMSVKTDYELLCNIVHPSLGSFQLFSGSPGTDATYGFHHIVIGKNKGRMKNRSNDPLVEDGVSSYGIFSTAISESMVIASQIYVSILEFLTAIGDDIALTAEIEPLSFHKTWRYPKRISNVECLCVWKELGGCNHNWGAEGPQLHGYFCVDVQA